MVLHGESRKTIPWKKLGAYIAEHMPEEIDDLLSEVTVNPTVLDSELAKALDPDWFKNPNPVRIKRSGGWRSCPVCSAGSSRRQRSQPSASSTPPRSQTPTRRPSGSSPRTGRGAENRSGALRQGTRHAVTHRADREVHPRHHQAGVRGCELLRCEWSVVVGGVL